MPSVVEDATRPPKLENPANLPDFIYVPSMRERTTRAVAAGYRFTKSQDDRDWNVRQALLQVFREHGFRVVLRPGDIGYEDGDVADLVASLDDGLDDTQPADD